MTAAGATPFADAVPPEGEVSTASAVRHEIENHLTRYAGAVDDHDLEGVLRLLGDARVSFGTDPVRGVVAVSAVYQAAFENGGRTRHLLYTVDISPGAPHEDGSVAFVARTAYQRWSMAPEPPSLTALGRYTARFAHHDGALRLTALSVSRDWQA